MAINVNDPARQKGMLPTPPIPDDLPTVGLSENARQVLVRRYVRRGDDGKPVETVEEMFWRVAYHIAAVETAYQQDALSLAKQFYVLLTDKSFFPNSPTFTGAGTPLGQLAACFVLPISDDMGRDPAGIFTTLRNAALIQQTGGGNGFNFSRLRPKGSFVKTSAGQATGPVGFLRVYDNAFGEIAQGGTRRGANMAVLRVDHPDIEEFVTCKTSENAITNFNISVGITDAFMRAVEEDADWDLRFPDVASQLYKEVQGPLELLEKKGVPIKVYKTIRARELFDKIVEQAHHNGEPGLLFLDAANRSNPVPHLYQLEATNPCFIGATRIATDMGLVKIADLAETAAVSPYMAATDMRTPLAPGQASLLSVQGVAFHPALPAWKTRESTPVLRLTTSAGYSVVATPEHPFLTAGGRYVPLSQLKTGDRLLIQSGEGAWSRQTALPNRETVSLALQSMGKGGDHASGHTVTRADFSAHYANIPETWSHALGFVTGTLVGDGWLSPTSNAPVGMVFAKDKPEALELVQSATREWFGGGHLHERASVYQLTLGRMPYEFFHSLGVLPLPAHQKRVPESIWQAPRHAVVGFLQGLFTADGTVNLSERKQACSIRLASASLGLLEDTQLLLLNFGIASRIHLRRQAGFRAMPDGKNGLKDYLAHADYELIVDKANRDAFIEKIGFIDEAKQQKARNFIAQKSRRSNRETFETTVRSIEAAGVADVYDLTEPATHSLIANGFVAHNCGEQFLGPYENCCLGSVNLAQHLGPDGTVDWEKLAHNVRLATRFLDDVVDANQYVPAVPQLKEAALKARRIGLGIMGLGDLMYHAGIRYGSPEGQEFSAQVIEFVRYQAMLTSIDLAKERGPFPAIQGSIYDPEAMTWQPPASIVAYEHNWGRPAIDWDAIDADIRAHGIRNAAQTTVAPTGTIATVAGCEGYGCEPVFALAYIRHVNDNGKDLQLTYSSPLFEKALARLGMDPEKRQEIVEQVLTEGTCQHIGELPEAIRDVFAVSGDISAEEHVRMQAAMQAFVDNSLSKTINFPPGATLEDVATAYHLAWKLGCKGITVYVTGSRDKVVLETLATVEKKQKEDQPALIETPAAPKAEVEAPAQLNMWHDAKKPRPRFLKGYTFNIETPLGKAFVTINENGGGQPFEVFINTAKAGSDTAAVSEAIGRLASYILRISSPVEPRQRLEEIVRQLIGIGGGRSLGFGPHRVRSLPDGVAQVIDEYLHDQPTTEAHGGPYPSNNGHEEQHVEQPFLRIGDLCPECGQAALVNEEGCRKCYACGHSEC